jgi:AsmA protein
MAWRTLPRAARIGVWSLAGLVGLVIVGGVVFALSFDPDRYKPQVVAAVKQATGRDLTLQGHIRLALSLQPTLTVQGVSFANPPGFSRPEMATLERLDVEVALIPLLSHRVEIDRLVLVKPDIILETNAQGQPNWQFAPQASPAAPQPAAGGPQAGTSTRISVADVRIDNGTLTWRDGATGRSTVLGLTSLRADAPSPDANVHLTATATYNSTPFSVDGELGPLTRLQDPTSSTPWPVQMRVEAAGAKVAIDGTLTQPLQGRGYTMKLRANVPDVAALAPFVPGQRLPPLHDVGLAAQAADTGATMPEISSLTLHVGPSDLTATVAGLKLDKLDIDAPRLDQPFHVAAQGSFDNAPATLAGTLGALATYLPGAKAPAPVPIDLALHALGSSLTVKGTAARGAGGRPSVRAEVVADKIDLDAVPGVLAKPPAQATAAPKTPPAPKVAASGRMIPDTPIPFNVLRLADADVKLNVAQLKSGDAIYRAIATHLNLQDGKLQLDPVSADLPEGHLDAALRADATQASPPVALRLRIPALALQPLLAAMHEPAFISGNLNVQADLHGAGTTPHAIAASLDGSLGLSMAGGTVDNRILGSSLGSILREVNLLDMVGRGGTSQVQCFVARLDANHGIATVRSLVFASSLLTLDGDGSLNLGAETLDLHVRPQARVAGTGLVVPLRVTGPFRSPSASPDPTAAVTQNAGTVAGAVLSTTTPLGIVAGALGALGAKQVPGGGEANCGGVGAPAVSHPAPPAPQQQQKKPPDVGGILKQLFR